MSAIREEAAESNSATAPVTRKVASVAHEAVDTAAVRAENVEKSVRSGASEASDTLEKSQEAAMAQIDETIKSLDGFMKKRPVAAAGIAFAIGAIATSLLRR